MGQGAAMTGLLLLALLLANAPFVFSRFLGLGANKTQKPAWLVLELLLAYGIFVVLGRAIEAYFGQNAPQAWQFYAVSLCLFLCMAFPGFVWRYLLKK
jgi:hypothetical protein